VRKRIAIEVAILLAGACYLLAGCAVTIEGTAYKTIVAAKAFLDSERAARPECATLTNSTAICVDIRKAVGAKDLLIDATESYCGGPSFTAGGKCQAPAKGTPAATQGAAKIQAALDGYNQTAADLKTALGGN
jgi:hypothetical protein